MASVAFSWQTTVFFFSYFFFVLLDLEVMTCQISCDWSTVSYPVFRKLKSFVAQLYTFPQKHQARSVELESHALHTVLFKPAAEPGSSQQGALQPTDPTLLLAHIIKGSIHQFFLLIALSHE